MQKSLIEEAEKEYCREYFNTFLKEKKGIKTGECSIFTHDLFEFAYCDPDTMTYFMRPFIDLFDTEIAWGDVFPLFWVVSYMHEFNAVWIMRNIMTDDYSTEFQQYSTISTECLLDLLI